MTIPGLDVITAKEITIFRGKNPLMKIELPEEGSGSIWDGQRGTKLIYIEKQLSNFSVEKKVCFAIKWEPETKPAAIYIRAEGKLISSQADNPTEEKDKKPPIYVIKMFSGVVDEETLFLDMLKTIGVAIPEGEEIDQNSVKDMHLEPEFQRGFIVPSELPLGNAYDQFRYEN